MLDKLLNNLPRLWNKASKDLKALEIAKGTGIHDLVTVTTEQLVFHSAAYHDNMPVKQAIILDGYTISELVDQISTLGYTVTPTSEVINAGYMARKACTLMPIEGSPLSEHPVLSVFTSNLWQLLYPIARILKELDEDTDAAPSQLCLDSASGSWLDYWGTFCNLPRGVNESDADYEKRVFMTLAGIKTTAIAIHELLKRSIKGESTVADVGPAQFSVTIDPDYIDSAAVVHQIVKNAKGAGIDYFLNYQRLNEELYKAYFKDMNQMNFANSDTFVRTISDMVKTETPYGYQLDLSSSFKTGSGVTGSRGTKLLSLSYTLQDSSLSELSIPWTEQLTSLTYIGNPFTLGTSLLGTPTNPDSVPTGMLLILGVEDPDYLKTDVLFSHENGTSLATMTFTKNGVVTRSEVLQ